MKPENVKPNNFNVVKLIYETTYFSIAYGNWVEEDSMRLAMRWNGENDADAGYPKVFGHPMWFIIPEELITTFANSLLDIEGAKRKEIIEVLKEVYGL